MNIPIPVALAIVATVGYLFGRRSHQVDDDLAARSRRELRRAQQVANDLEKIAYTIRQCLASHNASVNRFKDRVGRLGDEKNEAAFKELCREADEILRPTMRLASQIANAYDEIRQQSANLMTFTEIRTDPLTGLQNRRGLDDALTSQFAMMNRYETHFSLALFDIDHFKRVNDEQGHLFGDRILQELAAIFDESVRATDIVARYGGEEFVVIMPQTDLTGASVFSDRLRCRVAERMRVTVSAGVAEALDGDSSETIIARADAALYEAKDAGRNRVYLHDGDHASPVEPQADAAATA